MKRLLIFFYFLNLISKIYAQITGSVTVNTPRGTVVGYHFDQGNDTNLTWYGQADVFLGIPFAVPPIGEFRYKQPRPITKYPGTSPYNATYFRKPCIQPVGSTVKNLTDASEDCLYVNVWTPNASSITKYPVMVFIHGGGLITGAGHWRDLTTVRNLVSKGVIVATLEYRMSWLGFFTTFTDDFPPNIGMLDQVLALRFIKEEISYFGGDPNKITIFGESAGGHSVSSHTYSPLSQNLFQQYIAESSTVLTCYEDSLGHTDKSFYFAEYACNYTREMWDSGNFAPLKDCLMKLDVQDGMHHAMQALYWNGTDNFVCWNMVQDNYFLPAIPQTLGKTRPNIPAMIGTCKDEYFAWEVNRVKSDTNLTTYTRQNIEARIAHQYMDYFGNHTQEVLQLFEDTYLPSGTADDDHLAWLQFRVDVGTPAYFTRGALRDVEYYLANNNPNVYLYEFVWSSVHNSDGNPLPYYKPAPHGCEMPYVYSYGNSSTGWDQTDQDLANLAQNLWVNFVKYGKPTTDGTWRPATSPDHTALEYFEFNNVSSAKTGYRAKDEIVWNQQLPKILGDSPPNLPDNYPVCSRGYQSKVKNTTCYEAFGSTLTWNDAQTACETNSYGSLVTISSAFENSDLLTYVKKASPNCTSFYIGLFKSSYISDNNWFWVNYDTGSYRNWKNGFPNPNPTSNCTVLNANDGTWTNVDCATPQCYVCSYL